MKKILTFFLVLIMVITLIPAAVLTASSATNATVDITLPGGNTGEIQLAIDVMAEEGGGTVTVTGSRTNVNTLLKLTIPENVKLVWKAVYTGSPRMLELSGAGIFEIAEGADIQGMDDWIISCNASEAKDLKILVSGGSVSGSATAISGNKSNITVTGGALSTTGKNGCAIRTDVQGAGTFAGCAGNVMIDGGEILATGSNGVAIQTSYGNITINGGKITATGENGQSVYTGDGNIDVNGGTITAVNRAVNINGVHYGNFKIYDGIIKTTGIGSETVWVESGIIAVYGGEITAEGNNSKVLGARNQAIVYGGKVNAEGADSCAIYLPAGVGAYLEGTCIEQTFAIDARNMLVEVDAFKIPRSRHNKSTGITIILGEGTAVWDCTGERPVIILNPIMVGTPKIEWGEYTDKNELPEKGDINFDGKVNGMDLLLMKQHILDVPGKKIAEGTDAFWAADMNDDDKINGMDLLLLKKKILK